jgi:hypothetical protein
MTLPLKYYNKVIYWRNPEKNYAFEAIGKIKIGRTGELKIVYNAGVERLE